MAGTYYETGIAFDERDSSKSTSVTYTSYGDGEVCLLYTSFGNIERSTKTDNKIDYAQFEIPAHKWVDVYRCV